MNRAEKTIDVAFAEFPLAEYQHNIVVEAMNKHSIDFLDWCVKQGRVKVYHSQEELENLYSQFNKSK